MNNIIYNLDENGSQWEITYVNKNDKFPILQIDNWYSEKEMNNIYLELDYYMAIGKENMVKTEKDNSTAVENDIPLSTGYRLKPHRNDFYSCINRCLMKQSSKKFNKYVEESMPQGNSFKHTNFNSSFISYYEDGDYYKSHTDIALFSCLIWIYKEPKNFTGGDITFSQCNTTIQCKNNRMIFFPSYYLHEVSEINLIDKNKSNSGRFCITHFFYINGL